MHRMFLGIVLLVSLATPLSLALSSCLTPSNAHVLQTSTINNAIRGTDYCVLYESGSISEVFSVSHRYVRQLLPHTIYRTYGCSHPSYREINEITPKELELLTSILFEQPSGVYVVRSLPRSLSPESVDIESIDLATEEISPYAPLYRIVSMPVTEPLPLAFDTIRAEKREIVVNDKRKTMLSVILYELAAFFMGTSLVTVALVVVLTGMLMRNIFQTRLLTTIAYAVLLGVIISIGLGLVMGHTFHILQIGWLLVFGIVLIDVYRAIRKRFQQK